MDEREASYRKAIQANLNNVLQSGFIPELGEHKKGKRSDVHFYQGKVIMVASDRVSCFDRVLSRCIPFKGAVLNMFTQWAMNNSRDVAENAMQPSPDVNVVVQRFVKNSGVEAVVRGYVWGSLASDYEAGKRVKCGVQFPEGLLRYQKLPEDIFTPTSKADKGHDEDMTLEDIANMHGPETANEMKDLSLRLFARGAALARERGMILLDTKFEFGLTEDGRLVVIDESFTPDSSRYCDSKEYDAKWGKILQIMGRESFKDVSALLKTMPELKITEASKQFVRDVLIEAGYKEGKELPELADEQVIETSWRYIDAYERLTGQTFNLLGSDFAPRKRIMNNLVRAGLAYGGCVVPIGASEKDKEHWAKIEKVLTENKVPFTKPFYASAHKQTKAILDYVAQMDSSIEPIVYLTFAGRSNGLGPVVAGNTQRLVITCPAFSDTAAYMADIHSSLRMPNNLPLATIIDTGNAALYAKRIIDEAK